MGETRQAELTPEERVRRVKAALAEVGYPDTEVISSVGFITGKPCVDVVGPVPPDEVRWRAYVIGAPDVTVCWPCWSGWRNGTVPWPLPDGTGDCDHDPMLSPWPPSSPTAEPPER